MWVDFIIVGCLAGLYAIFMNWLHGVVTMIDEEDKDDDTN